MTASLGISSPPTGAEWFLLQSAPAPAAENMAWDEALLEFAAVNSRPVLRFYGWTEPAATFGYFQRFAEIERLTNLRPLIRRPTGGGLVAHEADWTYSIVIPPGDPWYELKAVASYRRVHEWIQAAFSGIAVETALSPARGTSASGQCFVGAEQFDVLSGPRKIAGAAQRRNRNGLLIQGSIQPPPGVSRAGFERSFCDSSAREGAVGWLPLPISQCVRNRVAELIENKYSRDAYNRGR